MGLNVYEVITDRIVTMLDQGTVPWRQPWSSQLPRNLVSDKEYRGVNVFLLGAQGFRSPYFCTYKQATAKGGQVRKGEKGTPVVFWKVTKKAEGGKERAFFILRYYTVFNVSQCDGLEVPELSERTFSPLSECESVVQGYGKGFGGPELQHGGSRACYAPHSDTISMPTPDSFQGNEEYYSTLFHEMTHSTGHATRLDRKGITDPIRFGSHDYSFEELVAECGAAFLCAHTGIVNRTIENSVAYIKHWSERLRSEPRWIVDAASAAAKACDLIRDVNQKEEIAEEED